MKTPSKSLLLVPLALVSFICFISYIAFLRPVKISQLVSNRYYEDEIKYQKVIDEKNNADHLKKPVQIELIDNKGIRISFPISFYKTNTKGSYYLLYYPNSQEDLKGTIAYFSEKETFIPASRLKKGHYNLILKWETKDKKYLIERKLTWK